MNNIFLISNSYTARTIIYNLDFVLGLQINKIILLNENHKLIENFNYACSQIVLCRNIEEGIIQSDFTIIIKDSVVNQRTHEIVKKMSKRYNKRYFIIEDPWVHKPSTNNNVNYYDNDSNKPLVLLLSLGEFTQQYCIEIMLNKIFSMKNIKFYQIFSAETNKLFAQLSEINMLNNKIVNIQNSSRFECDVIINTCEIDFNNYNNKNIEFTRAIYNMKPDFIFININNKIEFTDDIFNLFSFKYGYKINSIIKSQFAPIILKRNADLVPLYVNVKNKLDYRIQYTEDILLKNDIINDIFAHISLPDNIYIIK